MAGACGALVLLLSGLALVGWASGHRALAGQVFGAPPMKVNTAIALLAAALAVLCIRSHAGRRAGRACTTLGLAVALTGVVVIGEYLFGDLGIDTLLAQDPTTAYPGRPSPHTAVALVTIGLALATLRGSPRVSAGLTTATIIVVLFAVVGYAYGVDYLHGGAGPSGIAVTTLVAITALAVALNLLDPDHGIASLLRGDDAGAQMARVMLPVTTAAALLFGGAGYWLERHTGFELSLADAVYTLAAAGSLGVVVVVTARRLRRADQRLRMLASIVETAQDGIITNTLDGTITSWNAAAERIFGYPAAEMIGRPITHIAPPEGVDAQRELLRRVAAGEAAEVETRRRRRDGREIDVSLTLSPMRDADGVVVACSAIVRDITDERRADAERRRMAAVVASSADAVVSLDPEGRFTSWNPGAQRLLGYSADEILGRHVSVLVPDDRRAEFRDVMDGLVDRNEPVQGWETVRRTKDGELIDVELTVSPLSDADGEFTGATAIMRDIRERKEAGRRFATVLEAAPDAMLIVDGAGRIEQVNAQTEALFGYRRDELVGQPVEILVPAAHRDGHAALRGGYGRAPRSRMMRSGGELLGVTKAGDEIPVEISLSPMRTAGGLRVIAAVRDVTERRRAERDLAASEELFRRSFEDSGIGMALVGLSDGGLGHVLEVNEALSTITGYPAQELRAMEPLASVHPDDVGRLADDFALLSGGEIPVIRREARLIDAGGDTLWAAIAVSLVRDPDGTPVHAVIQVQDVTERKRFEGQLQYLADHDPLTGLFNRRRFEQELVREIAASRRYGTGGAVLVLDLDHFKLVNDTLGHAAGDALITIAAQVLRRRLRESDVLGRMGGDEFAVILPHADAEQSRAIGESLLREIRSDAQAAGASGSRRVTASIGIAPFGPESESLGAEDLLAQADIAMYDAKEAGRDRVAVYDASVARHERMQARVAWAERIEAALEDGRFVLHAQPILPVGADDGVPRYELLLRMLGEGGDIIPPGTFLYVAERSDLALRIDRWVVQHAVELLAEQHRLGHDVGFSVNLSGRSVNDREMLEDVVALVAGWGIPPGRLTFEVTETAAIVNVARATEFAHRLREVGCAFALDDFGAGFASFYYLKHLSFDFVKIDGEFIKDLPSSSTNQLVVRSVVDIARGMGKQTIAEYVGDQETMELLRAYGVDYAQGYFLGRPQPLGTVLGRVETGDRG